MISMERHGDEMKTGREIKYENILYKVAEGIATLTLNQPEKRNRLSIQTLSEIINALETAKDDDEVKVIIITGAGDKAFCAGADIREFIGNSNLDNRKQYEFYAKLCTVFNTLGKPSIASVRGWALAGGFGLAIYPDITIASEDAKFGSPEINVGVWPMMVSASLMRAVGRKKALEMMFTGDIIDAREAQALGLVNRVVSNEALEKETLALADKLKEKSPAIMKLGRDAFYTMMDMEFNTAIEYLKEMVVVLLGTEDAQEGCKAFVEKRNPVWKGR
jgi:enoyl-CoA hydratase/carnithine racemase